MKCHIILENETMDSILLKYKISYSDLVKENIGFKLVNLKKGNKLIIPETRKNTNITETTINTIMDGEDSSYQYVCPHCKNVIIVPK